MRRLALLIALLALAGCELILGIEPPDEPPAPALPCADGTGEGCADPDDFTYRRQLFITAGSADVPPGYSVSFEMDTAVLSVDGKVRGDGRDWRLFRVGGGDPVDDPVDDPVEIDRWVDDADGGFGSGTTRTWFRVSEGVAADTSLDIYYIYYGQENIDSQPQRALDRIFLFGDDFEGDLGKWNRSMRTEQVQAVTDEAAGGGQSLRIEPGGDIDSGLHLAMELSERFLVSHHVRQEQLGSSLATFRALETSFGARDTSRWHADDVRAWVELDMQDEVENCAAGSDHVSVFEPFGQNTWRKIEIDYSPGDNALRIRVDGGSWQGPLDDWNQSGAPVQTIAVEGEGQSGMFYVDNYVVRRFVDPEPTVMLGPEEVLTGE